MSKTALLKGESEGIVEFERALEAIGFNSIIDGTLYEPIPGGPFAALEINFSKNIKEGITTHLRQRQSAFSTKTPITSISISLQGNLSPLALENMLNWMRTETVTKLEVVKDISPAETLMILKELPYQAAALQKLDLRFSDEMPEDEDMENRLMQQLVGCLFLLTNLQDLSLVGAEVKSENWEDFAKALGNLKKLESLNLSDCDIDDHKIKFLTDKTFPNCPQLQELNLDRNIISDRGAELLNAAFTRGFDLKALSLSDNEIGDGGANALANLLITSTLKTLFLYHNNITDIGATVIANMLPSSKLEELDISKNLFGDDAILSFATALGTKPSPALSWLTLTPENLIADETAITLARSIRGNSNLGKIEITDEADILPLPVTTEFAKAAFARVCRSEIPELLDISNMELPILSQEEQDKIIAEIALEEENESKVGLAKINQRSRLHSDSDDEPDEKDYKSKRPKQLTAEEESDGYIEVDSEENDAIPDPNPATTSAHYTKNPTRERE